MGGRIKAAVAVGEEDEKKKEVKKGFERFFLLFLYCFMFNVVWH